MTKLYVVESGNRATMSWKTDNDEVKAQIDIIESQGLALVNIVGEHKIEQFALNLNTLYTLGECIREFTKPYFNCQKEQK